MILRARSFAARLMLVLLMAISAAALFASCSRTDNNATKVVEEYAKSVGAKETAIDLFRRDPNNSSRAYISTTITYNVMNSKGNLQKEYLGFIVKRENSQWKIESAAPYTKDETLADTHLSGQ